jgi:hypothetical protein
LATVDAVEKGCALDIAAQVLDSRHTLLVVVMTTSPARKPSSDPNFRERKHIASGLDGPEV